MKPILYDSTAAAFDSNGIGILADAVSCIVMEERNGEYELAMEYPVTGIHFREIASRSIIKAKPNPTDDPQPFRVYRITKPFNGIVTVYASHISYDLSGIPIEPFSAASAPAAMAGMAAYSAVPNPFTFWTDKTTAANFTVAVPSSARSLLGGQQGSLLDVYGGEYAYDGYMVRLYAARGENRGVSIRYGKNLTSLEQDENCANVYTGVYPYWTDGTALVQLPEKIVYAAGEYNFTRILSLDCSTYFDAMPTEAQLRNRAERYIEDNNIGVPKVSLTVSFVQLEQTEEYKHLALLERVSLCDTVNVEFPAMGVSATAKCVKTEYDVLMGRYKSVGLGDARTNIADTIVEQQKQIERMPSTSFLMQAVENLTGALLGARGGTVRMLDTDGDGEPDTLYIADDPDPEKAIKVWRFNYEGWGASENGYNGPYTMGASLERGIVADFITTGTLLANLIKAGVLQSLDGETFYLDLEAGVLRMQATELSISGKTVEDIADAAAEDAVNAQTQEDIFNLLTNGGALQGLYMEDGELYVNASYLKSGEINAELITAGILSSADGNVKIDLDSGTIAISKDGGALTFAVDEAGNVTANNATLNGGTFSGELQAATGTFQSLRALSGGSIQMGNWYFLPDGLEYNLGSGALFDFEYLNGWAVIAGSAPMQVGPYTDGIQNRLWLVGTSVTVECSENHYPMIFGLPGTAEMSLYPQSPGTCNVGTNTYYFEYMHSITFTQHSDRRSKTNILDLEEDKCIEFVKKIPPKSYSMITRPEITDYGFVAQDVEQAFNEVYGAEIKNGIIQKGDDSEEVANYSLNYISLIPFLTLSVQKIMERIGM